MLLPVFSITPAAQRHRWRATWRTDPSVCGARRVHVAERLTFGRWKSQTTATGHGAAATCSCWPSSSAVSPSSSSHDAAHAGTCLSTPTMPIHEEPLYSPEDERLQ